MMGPEDCFDRIRRSYPVSRETEHRLRRYVALVEKWQPAQNLISPKTLSVIWERHVLDSAQLIMEKPSAKSWLDLGSGAGFPGLVTAILLMEQDGKAGSVTLVESNTRKCAFLRSVIRETGCSAQVINGRIESVISDLPFQIDVVSARALASFRDLCYLVEPVLKVDAAALFHKGREFASEIKEASAEWRFDLVQKKSIVDNDSVIAEVRFLSRIVDANLV